MTTQFSDRTSLGRASLASDVFQDPHYGPPLANDRPDYPDDSEAETERMHDSPTKKRLAEEVSLEESHKRVKLAGRDRSNRSPLPSAEKPGSGDDEPAGPDGANVQSASRKRNLPVATKPAPPDELPTDVSGTDNESEGEAPDEPEAESNEDRLRAIEALTEIEVAFSRVRDRLHDQQLARFDLEIMMCSDGTHPELQHYHEKITSEREERLRRVGSLLCYQMDSIHAQSRAGRCSTVQTYLKNRFQLRTEMLNEVTQKWYQANREKQESAAVAPHYGYVGSGLPHNMRRPPVKRTGVKTHPGLLNMPAAPPMPHLTDAEQDEDLRSLGLL